MSSMCQSPCAAKVPIRGGTDGCMPAIFLGGEGGKVNKKGVTPGGVTPIRRSRTTLLPVEGPPQPFRPRYPARTDHNWAERTGPAIPILLLAPLRPSLSAAVRGPGSNPRMNPEAKAKSIQARVLHRMGYILGTPTIHHFRQFVKDQFQRIRKISVRWRAYAYETPSFRQPGAAG